MSEFLDTIKVTQDEKKEAIYDIILKMMYASNILSMHEIIKSDKELNQNEIVAAYSLGKEIKISMESNKNDALFNYLELKSDSINKEKMLEFINETVKDIEKARLANQIWSFQPRKILEILKKKEAENKGTRISNLNTKKAHKMLNSNDELEK